MELNAIIAESSSAFYTNYQFIVNIIVFFPKVTDTSTVLPFNVVAEQEVFLQSNIIKNRSKVNDYALQIAGGWILKAKTAKSKSKVYNFGASLGEPAVISHNIFSANSRGLQYKLNLDIASMINFNDDVYLLVMDREGNFKVYRGLVRDKDINDKIVNIKSIMGEGILSERIVKQDYDNQDVGLTVKQIIETYCSPLTTSGVNTNTGYIAPIKAKYKTALQVIESIRREYGLHYFIGYDWDFNLYRDDEITEPDKIKIRLGD